MNEVGNERELPPGAGLIDVLQARAGTTALVEDCYGGVRIIVLDPVAFPWRDMLEMMVERQHEVWVRRGEQGIEIISQTLAP